MTPGLFLNTLTPQACSLLSQGCGKRVLCVHNYSSTPDEFPVVDYSVTDASWHQGVNVSSSHSTNCFELEEGLVGCSFYEHNHLKHFGRCFMLEICQFSHGV